MLVTRYSDIQTAVKRLHVSAILRKAVNEEIKYFLVTAYM